MRVITKKKMYPRERRRAVDRRCRPSVYPLAALHGVAFRVRSPVKAWRQLGWRQLEAAERAEVRLEGAHNAPAHASTPRLHVGGRPSAYPLAALHGGTVWRFVFYGAV